MTTTRKHGGRRKGAGRKPAATTYVRQTVYLDQRHVQMISEWQDALVPRLTFSAALRQILDYVQSMERD